MEKGFLKSSLFMLLAGGILYGAQTKTQISMLYVAILNRASEGEGNRYWQTSQPDMATTANAILNTDDAKAYFGTSLDTNQAFVKWIYKNTLNKTESDDPDGIAYWVNELNSGKSKGEVVATLVNAALDPANAGEAQEQFKNRIEVSNYMADTVEKAPADYATSTSFSSGLKVTSDPNSVDNAKQSINLIATNSSGNVAPTANAGADQTIFLGDTLYLDASGSSDSDGAIVNYTWQIDTNVFETNNAQDSFIPANLSVGTYTLTLTVTDDDGAMGTDTATITVKDESDNDLPSIGGKK